MSETTLQALLREGVIKLLHDYRSGSAYDWSGNGNTGTLSSGCKWTGPAGSLRFPSTTDEVTVADAAELRLTAGSIVAVSEHGFTSQTAFEGFVSKRGATPNYELYADATRLYLIATTGKGSRFNGRRLLWLWFWGCRYFLF